VEREADAGEEARVGVGVGVGGGGVRGHEGRRRFWG
jgi:hypothetical protein